MRRTEHITATIWIYVLLLALTAGCSRKVRRVWADPQSVTLAERADAADARKRNGLKPICGQFEQYIPESEEDPAFPTRIILMEFHYMNSEDSTQNYQGETAVRFSQEMIDAVNEHFASNQPMWLPLGNSTPVKPIKIRCQMAMDPIEPNRPAVYFHYDDEQYYFVSRGANRNNSDPSVFKKYKTRDSVLSVFVMPHHRDSIVSPTYPVYESGISLREGLKLAGLFEKNKTHGKSGRGLLAHELGHTLGLSHTWPGYDGCDDTPAHTNCWNFGPEPPCDKEVSNNLMDYNPYQTALTPCQIGKMHLQIARLGSPQRRITLHDWCDLDTTYNVRVSDSVTWMGSRDLKGHIFIEEGGSLSLHCRVSMPENSHIYVAPGATLYLHDAWLHNSCGRTWEGIILGKKGKLTGKIVLSGDSRIEDTVRHAPIRRTDPPPQNQP